MGFQLPISFDLGVGFLFFQAERSLRASTASTRNVLVTGPRGSLVNSKRVLLEVLGRRGTAELRRCSWLVDFLPLIPLPRTSLSRKL
jgi:hypothetical protein